MGIQLRLMCLQRVISALSAGPDGAVIHAPIAASSTSSRLARTNSPCAAMAAAGSPSPPAMAHIAEVLDASLRSVPVSKLLTP